MKIRLQSVRAGLNSRRVFSLYRGDGMSIPGERLYFSKPLLFKHLLKGSNQRCFLLSVLSVISQLESQIFLFFTTGNSVCYIIPSFAGNANNSGANWNNWSQNGYWWSSSVAYQNFNGNTTGMNGPNTETAANAYWFSVQCV